jgi:hypothetical protein
LVLSYAKPPRRRKPWILWNFGAATATAAFCIYFAQWLARIAFSSGFSLSLAFSRSFYSAFLIAGPGMYLASCFHAFRLHNLRGIGVSRPFRAHLLAGIVNAAVSFAGFESLDLLHIPRNGNGLATAVVIASFFVPPVAAGWWLVKRQP